MFEKRGKTYTVLHGTQCYCIYQTNFNSISRLALTFFKKVVLKSFLKKNVSVNLETQAD